jgi:serine/threonine protein kinase
VFTDVLSRRTAYGLIWLGQYQKRPCVIKMIMLTTGFHYDKTSKEYRTPHGRKINETIAEQYFNHNDKRPFYHMDFRHRRSMTPPAFFKELEELINLGKLGIAPEVYSYGINQSFDIHYAFIVMEKIDCSLKDIYLTRDLHHDERTIIKNLIDTLHDHHEIIHGDLKPSNIGVFLDRDKRVINGCFFDCQKIKHKKDYTEEQFKKLAEHEANNYKKHIIKNKLEGAIIS